MARPADQVLAEATFNPKVVGYKVVSTAIAVGCSVVGIPFLVIILPLVNFLTKLEYKRLRCELTARNLHVKRGILNRVEQTIPLDKITDLALYQGPIMRKFDIDGLRVETAGSSGPQGGALVSLLGVQDAKTFRDRVLDQRDSLAASEDATRAISAPAAPSGATIDPDRLVALGEEIRDALHRIETKLTPPTT